MTFTHLKCRHPTCVDAIVFSDLLSLPNQVKTRQKLRIRLRQRHKYLFVDSNTVSKEKESCSSWACCLNFYRDRRVRLNLSYDNPRKKAAREHAEYTHPILDIHKLAKLTKIKFLLPMVEWNNSIFWLPIHILCPCYSKEMTIARNQTGIEYPYLV